MQLIKETKVMKLQNVKRKVFLILSLTMICLSLASCGEQIRVIETYCLRAQPGTISLKDTRRTKEWMRTYETERRKCYEENVTSQRQSSQQAKSKNAGS